MRRRQLISRLHLPSFFISVDSGFFFHSLCRDWFRQTGAARAGSYLHETWGQPLFQTSDLQRLSLPPHRAQRPHHNSQKSPRALIFPPPCGSQPGSRGCHWVTRPLFGVTWPQRGSREQTPGPSASSAGPSAAGHGQRLQKGVVVRTRPGRRRGGAAAAEGGAARGAGWRGHAAAEWGRARVSPPGEEPQGD